MEATLLALLMVLSAREASRFYNSATPMLQRQLNELVIRVSEELATPAGEIALKMLLFNGIAYSIPVLFAVMWTYRLVSWSTRADQRLWAKDNRMHSKKRELF